MKASERPNTLPVTTKKLARHEAMEVVARFTRSKLLPAVFKVGPILTVLLTVSPTRVGDD